MRPQAIHDNHIPRDVKAQTEEILARGNEECCRQGIPHQGNQVAESHVGPPTVVLARDQEHDELDCQHPGQRRPKDRHILGRNGKIEAEQESHPVHQAEHRQVDQWP